MSALKERESNLELFRIVCMVLIVAHHLVVTSGLMNTLQSNPVSGRSIYYLLFGMWGKIGINCFVLITGYFMCKSRITVGHVLKLFAEIYFYQFLLFFIFALMGKEQVTLLKLLKLAWPIPVIARNFVSCYILFYLSIPFLNVLVRNLDRKKHALLILFGVGVYSVLGTLPIMFTFNYVTWFIVLYFVASFIRMYPLPVFENGRACGWVALGAVLAAMLSVCVMSFIQSGGNLNVEKSLWFVSDSNRILALVVSVAAFLFFKNLNLGSNRTVNTIAATTFGVFLIHSQSGTMHNFLWNETFGAASWFDAPWIDVIVHSIGPVLIVFVVCCLFDLLRKNLLEKPFFALLSRHFDI